MSLSGWVTISGLVLDIVGVVLLWRFGLPPDVVRGGWNHVVAGRDAAEAAKAKRYDRIGHVAFGLILAGFVLQALGAYLGSAKS